MEYKIPLFDLNFGKEEEKAVIKTLRSKWISTGKKTIAFEDQFKEMLKAKYALAVSSCTAALHLALQLLNIKNGDEVITPSLTFVATVNAIKYVNAVPVFCDIIGKDNLNISPKEIEKKITKKTKAIIVMHYAGFPCQMDEIITIARKHRLKVIEDACHGPLSEYNGKKLGTIGDIGCFSFFSNKNIATAEGGMLVTNNEELFNKAKLLRSHGMTTMSFDRAQGHSTSYDVVALGYNYRMDDIRASIGIVQLSKIINDLKKRSEIRQNYIKRLSNAENLIIPFKYHTEFCSNYIFPVVLKDSSIKKRDLIRKSLQNKGIQTSIHYPPAHRFSIYKKQKIYLPNTEYVADNEITLPMFGSLSKKQIENISNNLLRLIA